MRAPAASAPSAAKSRNLRAAPRDRDRLIGALAAEIFRRARATIVSPGLGKRSTLKACVSIAALPMT